jgi:hypothetical protein
MNSPKCDGTSSSVFKFCWRPKGDIYAAKCHVRITPESGHVQCDSQCPLRANSGHSSAPRRASLFEDRPGGRFVQCDFVCWIWSSCAALQATHMRMGSTGLLYATQTRAPHCSHSQLNDGVGGIGISSTRGQVSTSRNSKSSMYERYTRNQFGPCAKSGKRKNSDRAYPHTTITKVPSRDVIGMRTSTK